MPLVTLTPFNSVVPETLTYYSYTSSLSPIAYWRLGDVAPASIDDTFTGIDGSPPNPFLWTITSGTLTLNANTLRSVDPTLSTSNIAVTKFKVAGDFDAQVDYNIVALDQSDAGAFNGIWIKVTADNTSNTSVLLYRWNNDVNGESSGYENYVDGVRLNTWTDNAVSNTNTSGVFSIVRTGSLITASVNGHVWSSIAFSSQNSTVEMHTRRESVSVVNFDVNFDNFVLNSGTIINPVATEDNNLYDGTYTGNPTQNVPSLLQIETDNPAVTFDGVDQDMVNNSIAATLNAQTSGSVSFLVSVPETGTARVAVGDDTLAESYIHFSLLTTGIQFVYRNSTGTFGTEYFIIISDGAIIPDIPYHLTFVQDDTDGCLLYLNGEEIITPIVTGTPGNKWYDTLPNVNGIYTSSRASSSVIYYNATIDEISIFDKRLSPAEISQMFTLTGISVYFEYMMSLSPVAYWRLGETIGETIAVDEAGSNNLTYINTPILETTGLLADGGVDTAATFNGTTQRATGSHAALRIVGDITVCSLFNAAVLSSDMIVSQGGDGDSSSNVNYLWSVRIQADGQLRWFHEYNTGANIELLFADFIFQANTTYHLIVSRNAATKQIAIYVNGVWTETQSYASNATDGSITTTEIGHAPAAAGEYWNGTLDEIVIYNSVLTPTEVAQSFLKSGLNNNAYFIYVNSLSPVAYWRLGELSGIAAVDEIGNYDSTYFGTPTLGSSSLLVGDVNTAVLFDELNDYAITDGTATLDDLSFAVTAIFKTTSTLPVSGTIVHHGNQGVNGIQGISIRVTSDGSLLLSYLDFGAVWHSPNTGPGAILTNQTYHLCVTEGIDEILYCYLNGVEQFNVPATTFKTGTAEISIGMTSVNRAPNLLFNGTIDEVAVFDKKLSQTEITNMYQKSIGN